MIRLTHWFRQRLTRLLRQLLRWVEPASPADDTHTATTPLADERLSAGKRTPPAHWHTHTKPESPEGWLALVDSRVENESAAINETAASPAPRGNDYSDDVEIHAPQMRRSRLPLRFVRAGKSERGELPRQVTRACDIPDAAPPLRVLSRERQIQTPDTPPSSPTRTTAMRVIYQRRDRE